MAKTATLQSEIGGDLVRVHGAITRALRVTIEHSAAYAVEGLPNASTWKGYLTYVRSLSTLLHGHHVTEDEFMFPYFRRKLPHAPYETLASQHRDMVSILEELQPILKQLDSPEAAEGLRPLNERMARLEEMWVAHAHLEEAYFGPDALDSVLTPGERSRAGLMAMLRGARHQWPPTLILPFLLYNMPPEDRAIMSQAIPGAIPLLVLVSRPLWKTMASFLLA